MRSRVTSTGREGAGIGREKRLLNGAEVLLFRVQQFHMPTNTIRVHRVLKAPPERVYRAFIDPAAMCKWMPPDGYTGTVHSMDAKVGGGYRMSFTNFTTGHSHSFGGTFIEMKEGVSLEYSDKFDDPNLPGEMRVTVMFKKVSCGTDLSIVQEGVPEIIPAEMCYLGWQDSLRQLAHLVEPELKDAM